MATILPSIYFPGGSEFTGAYKGPLNGAKLIVMDILEFRDINQRTLRTQISTIPSFLNQGAHCASPLGLIGCKLTIILLDYVSDMTQQKKISLICTQTKLVLLKLDGQMTIRPFITFTLYKKFE